MYQEMHGFLFLRSLQACINYLLVCILVKEMAFVKQSQCQLFCTYMISYFEGKQSIQASENKMLEKFGYDMNEVN
jgi:hypothetical protein